MTDERTIAEVVNDLRYGYIQQFGREPNTVFMDAHTWQELVKTVSAVSALTLVKCPGPPMFMGMRVVELNQDQPEVSVGLLLS